jgi:hypothetical protein
VQLGIEAAAVAAPFIAPHVHDLIDKVTGGDDDGPKVELPPGVHIEDD